MDKIIRKHRLKYYSAIGLSLISAVLMAVFAMRMGAVIDLVVKQDSSLIQKIISAVIIIIAWFIVSILYAFMKSKYVSDIVKDIKVALYKGLYKKEISEYVSKPNEYYLNVFTKNIDIINDNYLGPRCDIVANIISPTISVAVIFYIDWRLGLSFVGVSMVTIVLSQLPGILMKKKTLNFSTKSAEYLKVINNHLKGFEQVKLLSVSELFLNKYLNADRAFEKSRRDYLFTIRAAHSLGTFFSFFAQLMCISIGIWFVLSGHLTVGLLIAAINILNNVFNPIQAFVHNKNLLKSVAKIKNEMDQMLNQEDVKGAVLTRAVECISVKDVSLKFSEEKIIFDRFNLQFEKGKKYAIVGESGRGKSTLVKLIMKYYDAAQYSGAIEINGENVNDISSKSLYDQIAYIHRNDFFVDGTVQDNILLNRALGFDEQPLYDSLKFNSVFLDKAIESGSRNQVSTGEKQRVDIARFLVRDYEAMIFDEPTSNLDFATSKMIFDLIFSIKDKLVIVITHTKESEILSQFDEVIHL